LCPLILWMLMLANPQNAESPRVVAWLARGECVELRGVTACNYDYTASGKTVEAISFRPAGKGPFPAVLLIPGYLDRAADLMRLATALAREGFACLSVTQPGWGRSEGKPDFVGPETILALSTGLRRFEREPWIDRSRVGVFGHSRGGMAASLLAVELRDLRAVVLCAGIYDFGKEYGETQIPGIRDKMQEETHMTPAAVKERSSILRMEKLRCPVLILHGELDDRVPVSQALLLRDRLAALHKEFEIQLFPERGHDVGTANLVSYASDFFKRKLVLRAR